MKRLLAAALAGLLVLSLCACGEGGETKRIDTAALAEELCTLCGEGVEPIDAEIASGLYGVAAEEIVFCRAAGGVSAEEVTLLRGADEARAAELLALAETRLADRQEIYADYMPAEAEKLENALAIRQGTLVLVCVCGDSDQARRIATSYFS